MRSIYGLISLATMIVTSCAVIPNETVVLSETLGKDLQILYKTHRKAIELQYDKIKEDIDQFIDEVYSPFVIHYVLKAEYESFKKGETCIFKTLQLAAEVEGKGESDNVLTEMLDFQNAAHAQIEGKRKDLLSPIQQQETSILAAVDSSYENLIHANATLTGYLKSLRKVKEAQQQALSEMGLEGIDTEVTDALVTASDFIKKAINEGKKIDIESESAYSQFENITKTIKDITQK